jgi:DNA-binding NtrC family response regulator
MSKREGKGRAFRSVPTAPTRPAKGTQEAITAGEIPAFEEDLFRLKFERDVLHIFIEHARWNNGPQLRQFLENMEKTILCWLLERFKGSQKTTAEYLGIKYTTLHEKVKKHHICFFKQPVGLPEEQRAISGPQGR